MNIAWMPNEISVWTGLPIFLFVVVVVVLAFFWSIRNEVFTTHLHIHNVKKCWGTFYMTGGWRLGFRKVRWLGNIRPKTLWSYWMNEWVNDFQCTLFLFCLFPESNAFASSFMFPNKMYCGGNMVWWWYQMLITWLWYMALNYYLIHVLWHIS